MTRNVEANPALSVIIITPDSFETVRQLVRCLTRQSVRGQIELIIMAPSEARVDVDEVLVAPLAGARVIPVPSVHPTGPVRAAGVRASRAPVVVFAEEHSFPASGWAEALIAAHRNNYAAVGPAVRNANPDTLVSWADLFIGYGPWLAPTAAREMDFLPGHNSSYKRSVLLEYGDRLDTLMEAETVLQWDMRKKGHRLFLEPAAQTAHTNFGLWSSWVPVMYLAGRAFADTRAKGWPVGRRLAFTLASPAIPLVRLLRVVRDARRAGQRWPFILGVLPTLAIGLILDGVGQLAGYAFGAGGTHAKLAKYEWHRMRHTPAGKNASSERMHVTPRAEGSHAD
ncbi:MAG TPA: glycosyltransferase [Gemmatimonadaceae bacterium]|nr:glycosyltransferase [Gemmatimonadaceae bacterium]